MPSSHLILCGPLLLLPPTPPASKSFPMSQLFPWGGQSTGPSALASFLPKKSQGWSLSKWTGWISLLSKGPARVFSNTTVQKHQFSILRCSVLFTVQLSHPYMTTGKNRALTKGTSVGKVMYLLLNMLTRLVRTFLPRSKSLLISWLQSPSAVILEPRKIKSDSVSTVSPSISHEMMGPDAMIFVFWMLTFKRSVKINFLSPNKQAKKDSLDPNQRILIKWLSLVIRKLGIRKCYINIQHGFFEEFHSYSILIVVSTQKISVWHSCP